MGRERVHSSADPAGHVPAADLPVRAFVNREHDPSPGRPPRIICCIVVNVRQTAASWGHPTAVAAGTRPPPDLPEPDGSMKGRRATRSRLAPAQLPIADPRAVSGDDRPRRNDLCFTSHDGLAPGLR